MEARKQIENGMVQLQRENYGRILIYPILPVSGSTTYEFMDLIREIAQKYYPDGNVYVVGMPILLILVIQGSIWINFSVPAITGKELFFMSYLVVSSIQMGANIDYAIVISSRYMELKNQKSKQEAIIETMNFAFPTIVISGSILVFAGILIGQMTSEAAIVGDGTSGDD